METTERKLAAILAMDVVDYSAKMGRDEEGTLRHLKVCREIISRVVAEHRGRIFNTAGDAFMIEFASPVAAVSSAVDIQNLIKARNDSLPEAERMQFRMGVNMGDIIIEGENLYGEGINVAARLESIAPPGGICISDKIHAEVRRKFNFAFEDRGLQTLKNIEEPVHAFNLNIGGSSEAPPAKAGASRKPVARQGQQGSRRAIAAAVVLALVVGAGAWLAGGLGGSSGTGKQLAADTIVVLPVEHAGKDDEQRNFAAGLTQDLASALGKSSKNLSIIRLPRRPEDLSTVGAQAGAGYLIDGSLRSAGGNMRISVSLIDAASMATVWNRNFDRSLSAENIFAVQDEIVAGVIDELIGRGNGSVLRREVSKRVASSATSNLTVYECVNLVRGTFFFTFSPGDYTKSRDCLTQSVKLDPDYAEAWTLLAQTIRVGYQFGYVKDIQEVVGAMRHIDTAMRLDGDNGQVHLTRAGLLYAMRDWPGMYDAIDKALELSPNDVGVLSEGGMLMMWGGNCTTSQLNDAKGSYTSGDCRWQRGWKLVQRAHELDKANTLPAKHFCFASMYGITRQPDLILKHMQMAVSPGFVWYELYSGYAHDALGNKEAAKKYFDDLKRTIGSNRIAGMERHADFWNVRNSYWAPYPEVLKRYGFTS